MRALALDLSLTSTGWARNTELLWEVGTIKPRTKGTPRLQEVLDRVNELARGIDLVVIEGYAFLAKPQQSHAHSLGELGGVIRLYLFQKKIPYVEISPSTVKKLASGKGNADKGMVLVETVKRLKFDGSDHNEADALWLLQAALIHYGHPAAATLPQIHLDALKKVEWPKLEERAA